MAEKKATLRLVIAGDPTGGSKALRTISGDASATTGAMKNLAIAGGLVYGSKQLLQWGQQAVATYRRVGGEMLKLTRFTGETEEQVSGLWVAAQQSGVPIDKLTSSIGIFQTKLQNGQLDKLGLGLTDATGKAIPFDEALRKISDRFASMTDAGEKVNLSRQLFGRGGADLIPLLSKGGDALDEFVAKAEQLGLTLNSEDIKEATKNQRDFQLASTAAGFVIGKEVLPAVTSFTSFVARNLPPLVGLIINVVNAVQALPAPVKLAMAAFVLAGPAAKALSLLATPIKLTLGLMSAGKGAAEMFQFGLAGVTQKGAGVANMAGGLIAKMGGIPVALGVAGVAFVALGAVMYAWQANAQQAKQRATEVAAAVASIRSEAESTGKSIEAVFTSSTLVDAYAKGQEQYKKFGITISELRDMTVGSEKDRKAAFDAATKSAGMSELDTMALALTVDGLAKSYQDAEAQTAAEAEAQDELGVSSDEAADSLTGAATAAWDYAAALDRANASIQAQLDKSKRIRDAQGAVATAHQETIDATAALAEARRAADGDSDQYRDAQDAVADAVEAVGDAEEGVAAAQAGARDAQRDLNQAREDAVDRLREMAQATRDAVLAEADANLKVKEARQNLERVNADPRSTALEKERAALEVRMAEEAARQAGEDSRAQQQDNARAQAAGIEGDAQVVRAKAAVADAARKVRDAEEALADATRKVGDAQRAAAMVIVEAKAAVAEAQKRAEDAAINEASAWGDLATAQHGAATGVYVYREALRRLAEDLDPNSPLRQRLDALIADLGLASVAGGYGVTGTIGAVDPDGPGPIGGNDEPRPGGDGPGTGGDVPAGRSGNITVNQVLQGTDRQQRRAAATSATDVLDRLGRDTR